MATPARELSGEKAGRIVEAMRHSVGLRGAAGSTFDHVAREAGVSRGLLHYYFGSKERLLVEVCRRDCDIRMHVLDVTVAEATSREALADGLIHSLEDLVRDDPGFVTLIFELFTVSRHNAEVAVEMRSLTARVTERLAEQLEAKAAAGVIGLGAPASAVAGVLLALADGLALRMIADPEGDHAPTVAAGATAVRQLIQPPV